MRRIALLLALAALGVALAGCGGGGKSKQATTTSVSSPIKVLTVTEKEFSLAPKSLEVTKPGIYRFQAVNKGKVAHALAIRGPSVQARTASVKPGQSTTVDVQIRKAGTYELYCPLDGHRAQGMKATLAVSAPPSPGY